MMASLCVEYASQPHFKMTFGPVDTPSLDSDVMAFYLEVQSYRAKLEGAFSLARGALASNPAVDEAFAELDRLWKNWGADLS